MTTLRLASPAVSTLARITGLALPLLFIAMWSSGYVVGKLAVPYAGPFTLLAIRFGLASSVLLIVALAARAPWPANRRQFGHLVVVGLLI